MRPPHRRARCTSGCAEYADVLFVPLGEVYEDVGPVGIAHLDEIAGRVPAPVRRNRATAWCGAPARCWAHGWGEGRYGMTWARGRRAVVGGVVVLVGIGLAAGRGGRAQHTRCAGVRARHGGQPDRSGLRRLVGSHGHRWGGRHVPVRRVHRLRLGHPDRHVERARQPEANSTSAAMPCTATYPAVCTYRIYAAQRGRHQHTERRRSASRGPRRQGAQREVGIDELHRRCDHVGHAGRYGWPARRLRRREQQRRWHDVDHARVQRQRNELLGAGLVHQRLRLQVPRVGEERGRHVGERVEHRGDAASRPDRRAASS